MERKGERIGWIGGWIGSFLWLCALSILWFFQFKTLFGIIGLCLFCLAVIFIFHFEPSRFPNTKYWKLLMPMYLLLIGAIFLTLYVYGGFKKMGLSVFAFLWIIPLILPFFTIGNKTWLDEEKNSHFRNTIS